MKFWVVLYMKSFSLVLHPTISEWNIESLFHTLSFSCSLFVTLHRQVLLFSSLPPQPHHALHNIAHSSSATSPIESNRVIKVNRWHRKEGSHDAARTGESASSVDQGRGGDGVFVLRRIEQERGGGKEIFNTQVNSNSTWHSLNFKLVRLGFSLTLTRSSLIQAQLKAGEIKHLHSCSQLVDLTSN